MFDVKPITSPRPTDCGATCLAMLLDYYGTEVPLEDLIRECNTRLIGCTAADINRVGRAHGLDMRAWEEDAASLLAQDRPAIIWWRYSHWCVFCGLDDNGDVVICNPDRGRFPLDADSFATLYSGVALTNGEPQDLPFPDMTPPEPEPAE